MDRVEPIIGAATRSHSMPAHVVYQTVTRPAPASSFAPPVETVTFQDTNMLDDGSHLRGASETIRFRRPGEDDPVQILPGRLEVIAGESKHREIRFVRAAGEPAELIIGREPGQSPRHVALQSETVSRRHARFAFSNGHWAVANLSRTNPVVVNDERLADETVERTLADGDRLELGEVVLRFRAR